MMNCFISGVVLLSGMRDLTEINSFSCKHEWKVLFVLVICDLVFHAKLYCLSIRDFHTKFIMGGSEVIHYKERAFVFRLFKLIYHISSYKLLLNSVFSPILVYHILPPKHIRLESNFFRDFFVLENRNKTRI